MVFGTSLLNTQYYKVCIEGKVEPYRVGVAIEKGAFKSPRQWSTTFYTHTHTKRYIFVFVEKSSFVVLKKCCNYLAMPAK